ncbi:TPA: type 1 fimbrial protein [Klebsiella aerogenes]|nr:type 1 fimbrial protein [Klebsiella aerogenes]
MNMKKIVLAVAMSSVVCMGAAHAGAPDPKDPIPKDQGHGTITFKGSIIDAPCSISPDSAYQTVDLGEVSNVTLKKGGTSRPQNFDIKLEQCDTSTLKSVKATFTGAASASNPDLLGITGTAKGASIAITNGSGSVIKLGKPSPAQTLQDGDNTLAFSAYLQGDGASATIIPGSFQSVADFTLSYE